MKRNPIISENVIEKAYQKSGCTDYNLRSTVDLKAIYQIDFTKVNGYEDLTDENKALYQAFMSRKENPYDNDVMGFFYRTLKRKLVQDANYDNPEQARMDIFKYIETYYNTKRIHSALGWLSPVQFEMQNS